MLPRSRILRSRPCRIAHKNSLCVGSVWQEQPTSAEMYTPMSLLLKWSLYSDHGAEGDNEYVGYRAIGQRLNPHSVYI